MNVERSTQESEQNTQETNLFFKDGGNSNYITYEIKIKEITQ